jgi:Mg-chelatase subunit ChlD
MKGHHVFGFGAVLFSLLVATGCGTGGDSSVTGSDDTKAEGATHSGMNGFQTLTSTPSSDQGTQKTGANNVGNVEPGSSCATSSASVDAPPVHLVFMIDRSGSMGNSREGDNLALRWTPVVAGLNAFFTDSANTKVSASVAFFSQGSHEDTTECSAATYSTPAVAMMGLPSAHVFSDAFAAVSPGGGTPTKPALEGAIAYAQKVKATLPAGEKIAIVLATDGEPNDCSSTADNVAAAAATVASDIPTYVIGVGPDTSNLDEIAKGGGTDQAIMIATNDPAQVSSDLRNAIGQIKRAQLGCSYALPAAPAGQKLDVNAVNVDYTPAGGATQTLPYSADCSKANGWHYDNAANPSQIVMCAASCSTLQSDTSGGKVDIVFGCAIDADPGTDLPGGGVK